MGKAQYVYQLFTAIADKYDLVNSLLSLRQDKYWRRFAISQAQSGNLFLDVCTGSGELGLELSKRNTQKGRIIGIDFCPKMLEKAQNKLKRKASKRVGLILADAYYLPFPDNTFDAAFISFAIRNVPSIQDTFQEMARVVKPEGKVICLELTLPRKKFWHQVFQSYLAGSTFIISHLLSLSKEAYVSYLPHSLEELPPVEEIKQKLSQAGLKDTRIHQLTFGIATIYVSQKESTLHN